ncbi:ribosylnicotinamide kinase [Tieghemiomyces parasiticus]|uniref:Ribosylnicotinamide kinase n=1 Tax=Tieghemiomyces parasiticus TaxID=78921 RepID=A0A9W8A938_9FUNG|nr:ribosylnicotinamide kinase [Tieghemiomyces parasiticus]
MTASPATSIVGISGPTCSGKTTLARRLQGALPNVTLLHQDDFYLPPDNIPIDPATGMQDWDCDAAIDWPRLEAALAHFRAQGRLPVYRVTEPPAAADLRPDPAVVALAKELRRDPVPATLIVDGFMLYHRPAVDRQFDRRLVVEADRATLEARRRDRTGYQTTEGWWTDPPGYFKRIVWPNYLRHRAEVAALPTDHHLALDSGCLDIPVLDAAAVRYILINPIGAPGEQVKR